MDGQVPGLSLKKLDGPFTGYAKCDLWSGLSRFLPSQQLNGCFSNVTPRTISSILRWEMEIGPDAAAHFLGESLSIDFGIITRRQVIALEVGSRVASIAALHFHRRVAAGLPAHRIANKHAEAL